MSTILLINICIFGVEFHSVKYHIYGHIVEESTKNIFLKTSYIQHQFNDYNRLLSSFLCKHQSRKKQISQMGYSLAM